MRTRTDMTVVETVYRPWLPERDAIWSQEIRLRTQEEIEIADEIERGILAQLHESGVPSAAAKWEAMMTVQRGDNHEDR